jgi:hypothetical protein
MEIKEWFETDLYKATQKSAGGLYCEIDDIDTDAVTDKLLEKYQIIPKFDLKEREAKRQEKARLKHLARKKEAEMREINQVKAEIDNVRNRASELDLLEAALIKKYETLQAAKILNQ